MLLLARALLNVQFGEQVGYLTNYLALKMIFRPVDVSSAVPQVRVRGCETCILVIMRNLVSCGSCPLQDPSLHIEDQTRSHMAGSQT